jgi:hypothetical protein
MNRASAIFPEPANHYDAEIPTDRLVSCDKLATDRAVFRTSQKLGFERLAVVLASSIFFISIRSRGCSNDFLLTHHSREGQDSVFGSFTECDLMLVHAKMSLLALRIDGFFIG